MITIVALVCHIATADTPEACFERVVGKVDSMVTVMIACELPMPALAKWKAESIYAGPEWRIAQIMCRSGDYQPKDTI